MEGNVDYMIVNEIFLSIQGESLAAGYPTIFVRFTGCNLRCHYCDTTYAYHEGNEMSPKEVFEEIKKLSYKRVCLTGGEPLIQKQLNKLLSLVSDYIVTIETNGSKDLSILVLSGNQSVVMDMKSPSSGCSEEMQFDNFEILSERDEIKFVIGNRNDYEWAKDIISRYYKKGIITFSPIFNSVEYKDIVEWILNDKLDVRFQLQLHKFIWGTEQRGV